MGTKEQILGTTPTPAADIVKKAGGAAVLNAVKAASDKVGTDNAPAAQQEKNPYGWMDQFAQQYKILSPEEIENERKREKRAQMFSAIGDGISALSNLYFTSKGAPNAYEPKHSLSRKNQEYWDRIKREREAERERYLAARTRLTQLSEDWRRGERNYNHTLDREKEARELQRKQYDLQNRRLDYLLNQSQSKADARDADLNRKAADSEAKRQTEKSRQNYYNASAEAKRIASGGSGGDKKPTLNINGKIMTFNNVTDYNRAVERYAKEFGIDLLESTESAEIIGDKEFNKRRAQRKKSIARLAAEVEKNAAKKPNPMGSGKKQNPMK